MFSNRPSFVLSTLITFCLSACGGALESQTTASIQAASNDAGTVSYKGTDAQGKPCRLTLLFDQQQTLNKLTLSGTYRVDYKIPAPLSPLYGVYNWAGTFDTSVNAQGFSVNKSWLGGGDVVKGQGKAIFATIAPQAHTVTVNPSLANPSSVTYSAAEKIAVVVQTVTVDLSCNNLSRE